MVIASIIGVLVGGDAGYIGGLTDEALMRGTEFFVIVPVLVVILAVVRLFGLTDAVNPRLRARARAVPGLGDGAAGPPGAAGGCRWRGRRHCWRSRG